MYFPDIGCVRTLHTLYVWMLCLTLAVAVHELMELGLALYLVAYLASLAGLAGLVHYVGSVYYNAAHKRLLLHSMLLVLSINQSIGTHFASEITVRIYLSLSTTRVE